MNATKTDEITISEQQRQQYEELGYFVIEDLLKPAEVSALLQRIEDYTAGTIPVPEGLQIQLEPQVERGEKTSSGKAQAVRKIDNLVQTDDLFRSIAFNPGLVTPMQGLMGLNLKLYRNTALLKPPGIGSAKGVHQDSPYWPIEPMNLASCWIALDPAKISNGCMTVIPGSHKRGALPHETVTDDYVIPEDYYDSADAVPVEMKPGSGLVFHSLLIHGSAPNTSVEPRRAIVLSFMPSESRYTFRNKINPEPKPEYLRISGVDVPGGV